MKSERKEQTAKNLDNHSAVSPENVPIHDWQKKELDRRKANLMKHPASGILWEEVKDRVLSRYDC